MSSIPSVAIIDIRNVTGGGQAQQLLIRAHLFDQPSGQMLSSGPVHLHGHSGSAGGR